MNKLAKFVKYLPDSVLKKINNAKDYYADLGCDLKELGRDIVNGFKRPFMISVVLLGIVDLGLLNYLEKHHNETNVNKPLVIERQMDEKLVFEVKQLSKDEIGSVKKCKNLRNDYYETLNRLFESNLYKGKMFGPETEVVDELAQLLKEMNQNTQNLQYNYATLIKGNLAKLGLSSQDVQRIITKNGELNQEEKSLAVQLGVYEFLGKQIEVRQNGNLMSMMKNQPLTRESHVNKSNIKEGIKTEAKTISTKDFGEICMIESLYAEVASQDIFNDILMNLEKSNYGVDGLLNKAQKLQGKAQLYEQTLTR